MSEQSDNQRYVNPILLIHLVIVFVTLAILLFSQTINLAINEDLNLWKFLSIISFSWIIWSWHKIKKTLFDPYGLFILAAFLFNLSPVILELIPGNSQNTLVSLFPMNIVRQTIIVTDLSMLGLHLGALVATSLISKQERKIGITIKDRDISIVGYALILISLYPLYLTTKESIQLSISLGYNSLYRQALGTGILSGPAILANFIIPGVLFLLAGSKNNRVNRMVSLIIVISFTIAQLILGKRATAIMPLIAYLWLWHKTIKPLKVSLLSTLSLFFLLFVFPIIRLSRNLAGTNKFSWQVITDLFATTNPFLDVLNEMGSTIQTIAHTLQIIPDYRPFDWGTSYLYGLSAVIPNLFWNTHPVIEHGTFSSWLISIVNPVAAKSGGSIGYSFIAEAYANFGIYGSVIIVGLLGFLFVLFSEFVEKHDNKAYLAALATYASFFLFFARSESAQIFRPFVWYTLIPLVMSIIISKFRAKNV